MAISDNDTKENEFYVCNGFENQYQTILDSYGNSKWQNLEYQRKVDKNTFEAIVKLKKISKKTLGIILLRSGSRRIKNKNFLKIANKSMFEHVLEEANKSKIFHKIHLSTENVYKFKKLQKLCSLKKYKDKVEANF